MGTEIYILTLENRPTINMIDMVAQFCKFVLPFNKQLKNHRCRVVPQFSAASWLRCDYDLYALCIPTLTVVSYMKTAEAMLQGFII